MRLYTTTKCLSARQIYLALVVGGMLLLSQTGGLAQRDRQHPRRDLLPPPPRGTILGVFNPGPQSPQSVQALGARAVRFLVPIANAAGPNSQLLINEFASYHNLGFTVIVSVAHWNGDTKQRVGGKKPTPDPLPAVGSKQANDLLQKFDNFLKLAGPYIDYCAIDNEPMFDLAQSDLDNGAADAIAWYRTVAQHAQDTIKSLRLPVDVVAPALNEVQGEGKGRKDNPIVDAFLNWESADPNIQVVDLHLHVKTASDVDAALTLVAQRVVGKPIVVTEWSQAGAARDWLKQAVDPSFARTWKVVPSTLTNEEFIQNAYGSPVLNVEWNEFVSHAPYDPQFMQAAFAVMERHGVAVATYGAEMQYGNAIFDSKQLYANMTARSPVPPRYQCPTCPPTYEENYLFVTWFKAIANRSPVRR